MLKKLRIERFKSIYEQEIDFGKVNLLVGPNGSGKSNLLEALGILAAALSSGIDQTTLDLKGVRLSLPHLFKSAFKNHDLPKTFRLEAEFENGRYNCSIRSGLGSPFLEFASEALYDGEHQVFGRSAHGVRLHSVANDVPSFNKELVPSTRSVWSVIDPLVKISSELRRELDEFARFAIYAPQTAVMRGLAIDQRVVEPLGLTGSGLASALATVKRQSEEHFYKLMEIIWEPGWADKVLTGPFNAEVVPTQVRSEGLVLYIRDRFMKNNRNMLSAYDASEGTLYLIFVATLLAHHLTPPIFALDNIDGTLNPKLVRKLSRHVLDAVCAPDRSEKSQAFMTSHHPSSLDSFDIFDENHCIFVCSRDRAGPVSGRTNIRKLRPPANTTRDDWILKHGGRNLSELMLNDRIPGVL
ncbi:AAA family ATPase [Ancylobacter sp. WKF20]|uniref:AAA family ATPase n=1 Tax=Ancylobacter sp. WKF20 TaxID=3039801 RepID=UPI0024342006|nr:AAA family ATPase [Ancylobacter sp. WKF20]WGD31877.1 AAA family ATPase [Ancylobacter sp. WKF20]